MVSSDNFKNKIEQIISQDYKVEFLGNNFDQIIGILTDTKAEKIYNWVENVVKNKFQPIFIVSRTTSCHIRRSIYFTGSS